MHALYRSFSHTEKQRISQFFVFAVVLSSFIKKKCPESIDQVASLA